MVETWKDIEGYEGIYQVSNLGRIKSLDRMLIYKTRYGVYQHLQRGKIIRHCIDMCGYPYVRLHDKNGKKKLFKIHRIVGETFLQNPNNLPCINHKDENKTNNNVNNLEWCTVAYNNNYGTHNEKISKALKGIKRSEETKRKISLARTGIHLSESTKEKLSEINKGEKHPNYGKKRSPETIEKMKLARQGFRMPESAKQKLREAALRQWERKRASQED